MKLRFKKLHPDALTPTRAKPGDSGLDLYALLPDAGFIDIHPRTTVRLQTGIAVELPAPHSFQWDNAADSKTLAGFEAQVRGRSGLAAKGIIACGGIGTVDNGYRGEIGVSLTNTMPWTHTVRHGDRIAQLVVAPVIYPELEEVTELSASERGADGFGSTGR